MEEIIRQLIERGSIKVSDEASFRTKAECASLFGRNYSNILRGGVAHPKEDRSQLIFWQEEENDAWENRYTVDEKKEIVEFTERRKSKQSEWVTERLEIANSRIKNNIIFYKLKGGEYKFRGIFNIDEEETISSGIIVYKRVSSEASTYFPENKKPLKNLKEIVERGLIKENEEIYFYYLNQEYPGRVTKEGKIKIHSGTMTLNKASMHLIMLTPECARNTKTVNAYFWWKTWNGTSLNELRKI
jgi:hypothetical protein